MEQPAAFDPHTRSHRSAPRLDHYWMPFTANRAFKRDPLMVQRAKGIHYFANDGRAIIDGTSGLWCANAGHCRPEIANRVASQLYKLDYASSFQVGHEASFELAERLAALLPPGLDRLFFANSGSEGVDTALKIALLYHARRGESGRNKLVGRQRGYHGVNCGGTSVGGIDQNRLGFGTLLSNAYHIRHTHDLERNAFTRGQPRLGAELADDLESFAEANDPTTIAAVIVEPLAGSTGVLPPPVGYLERLRAICDRYSILLIFDEVITGFGRVGADFACKKYGVTPDIVVLAKAITNGAVPMSAVAASRTIHDAIVAGGEDIEFCHGYTLSGCPVACAAALATLEIHRAEGLSERASNMSRVLEDAVHDLRDLPGVIDIRNDGMAAAVEFDPTWPHAAYAAFRESFLAGLLVRSTGNVIAISPPLIAQPHDIELICSRLRMAVSRVFSDRAVVEGTAS